MFIAGHGGEDRGSEVCASRRDLTGSVVVGQVDGVHATVVE